MPARVFFFGGDSLIAERSILKSTCLSVSVVASWVIVPLAVGNAAIAGDDLSTQPGLVSQEFVFTQAPFRSCHASTLAETKAGLVAAWFGGSAEGHDDVGIWFASSDGKT